MSCCLTVILAMFSVSAVRVQPVICFVVQELEQRPFGHGETCPETHPFTQCSRVAVGQAELSLMQLAPYPEYGQFLLREHHVVRDIHHVCLHRTTLVVIKGIYLYGYGLAGFQRDYISGRILYLGHQTRIQQNYREGFALHEEAARMCTAELLDSTIHRRFNFVKLALLPIL